MPRKQTEDSPFGTLQVVLDAAAEWADQIPGVRLAKDAYEGVERAALVELRRRLDQIDPVQARRSRESALSGSEAVSPQAHRSIAATLSDLIDRSIDQTPEESKHEAFLRILDDLSPDEARILALLSDGRGYPLVHLGAGPIVGPATRRILTDVCNIALDASIHSRELTPYYISHLRQLGLVETGPEDTSLGTKYEILESHRDIRRESAHIEDNERMMRPKIIRRTLRLSALGRDLWAAGQEY